MGKVRQQHSVLQQGEGFLDENSISTKLLITAELLDGTAFWRAGSLLLLICRGRNEGAMTGKHEILSASEGAFLLGLKRKPTFWSQLQATSSYCFYYKQISLHHTVLFFLLTVQYGHPKILLFVLFFTHTTLKQNSVWKKSSFLQHSSTSKLSSNKMAFIHQPRFQTVKWLLLSYRLDCFLNKTPEYIASGSPVTSITISWRRRSVAGENTWTQCHDHRGRKGQDLPLVLRWESERGKLGTWCGWDSLHLLWGLERDEPWAPQCQARLGAAAFQKLSNLKAWGC